MSDIRGLVTVSPTVGWGLMLGTLAISACRRSACLRASSDSHDGDARATVGRADPAGRAGIAFAAIFGRVQPMVLGETTAKRLRTRRRVRCSPT
jgi:hydrogenase-4 component F